MQVIKFLDRQQNGTIIIKELDDTHVFVHKMHSAQKSIETCTTRTRMQTRTHSHENLLARRGWSVLTGCMPAHGTRPCCAADTVSEILKEVEKLQKKNHYS